MKQQPKRVKKSRANWPIVLNVKRVRLVGDAMPYNSTPARKQEGATPVRDVEANRGIG